VRVIAGEARGRPLRAPKGEATRPTSDRIKGSLFAMLEALLLRAAAGAGEVEDPWAGVRVLDLYAGAGARGIEALSRGAAWADFVDEARAACAAVEANLRATGLADRGRVWCRPVQAFLRGGVAGAGPYGIILADPPYADPAVAAVVAALVGGGWLAADGILAVEHSRRVALAEHYGNWRRVRERRHGDTVVSIWVGPAQVEALPAAARTEEEDVDA